MDVEQFQISLAQFIRAFGLHQTSQTPCGQSMTVSEAHTLTRLNTGQKLTQNELGLFLHLEKSSVSRLIAGLEEKGWIERFSDISDKRVKQLRLTKQGNKIHSQLMEARKKKFTTLLSHIPKNKHEDINLVLSLLIEACEQTLLEEQNV